jgi:hypothetical protein
MSYDDFEDFLLDIEDTKQNKSINVLALCRRVPECASVYLADEGKILLSQDLSGAEPNIMLNYTDDDMLRFFLKEAKGVEPYWDGNTLMTDSMYITYASRNKLGDRLIREAYNRDWDGKNFTQQYIEDADVIKKWLDSKGKAYGLYKLATLGLFYSLGAKGLIRQVGDYGITLTPDEAKEVWLDFWRMFRGVDEFQKMLRRQLKTYDHITNPFGFKINAEPHKVLNAFIQSSVSSFLSNLMVELDKFEKAEYVMTVHDELIYQMYPEDIEDFLKFRDEKLEELNNLMGFKYPLELGCVRGNNFYEAK